MDKIIGVIGGIPISKSRTDDTTADRLSHRFTTAILIVFAVLVSAKQFVGEPITCWVPAHFSGGWEEYTNSYCWVKNTYYLPFSEEIPKSHEYNKRQMIPYYQWVPIIFLIMALFFYIPTLIWRSLNNKSGIDIKSIVESGQTFSDTEKLVNRDMTLMRMTNQMDRYLKSQQHLSTRCTFSLKNFISALFVCCNRKNGTYLIGLYLVTKLLYIANGFCQMFLLNLFLGNKFHMYGIQVIKELMQGKDWTASSRFPRVTMCDFIVRRLGNNQRYTVQCVLPINLFNEKLFLFLWWWTVFIIAVQSLSFLKWIMRSISTTDNLRYIKKHLRLSGIIPSQSNLNDAKNNQLRSDIKIFGMSYLKPDGIFILRLIGSNTNTITVTDFVNSLWKKFLDEKSILQNDDSDYFN